MREEVLHLSEPALVTGVPVEVDRARAVVRDSLSWSANMITTEGAGHPQTPFGSSLSAKMIDSLERFTVARVLLSDQNALRAANLDAVGGLSDNRTRELVRLLFSELGELGARSLVTEDDADERDTPHSHHTDREAYLDRRVEHLLSLESQPDLVFENLRRASYPHNSFVLTESLDTLHLAAGNVNFIVDS